MTDLSPSAPQPTPAKPFWQSTAFWFNALSLIVLAADALLGANAIRGTFASVLVAVVAVGNVLIRRLSTTGPMTWTTPPDPGARMPRPEWTLDIETMRQLVELYDLEAAKQSAREGGELNPNG